MVVAFAAAAVVLLALLADLLSPRLRAWRSRPRTASASRQQEAVVQDPGRELRAEHKARELLRSCVNEQDWEMYRDLGFIRVWASPAGRFIARRPAIARFDTRRTEPECAYLIYPHLPIVAYVPTTHRLVGEYCVTFEDQTRPYGSSLLPEADDVLAKWMALRGDEQTVISMANMHLPGRQVAVEQVHRDLRRLAQWEQGRLREQARQWDRAQLSDRPSSGDQPRIRPAAQTDQQTAAAS